MSRVAIVAALEREVRPLIPSWGISAKEYSGRGFRFYEASDCVLVCGGIGAEAARRAADAVIGLYRPEIVYSVGFAGALDRSLQVGEVLMPRYVIDAGDASRVECQSGEGTLVTFSSIASREQKARLRTSFAAQAVDMEAAAVARAAVARGVKFVAVKAISDGSDFVFPAMDRFVDSGGQFRTSKFAFHVTLRPWLWAAAIQLASNSARASQALCASLKRSVISPGLSGAAQKAAEVLYHS